MANKYGKSDGQGGYDWYTTGEPFTWSGGYNHDPSTEVLLTLGYKLLVTPSVSGYFKLGDYIEEVTTITYDVIPWTQGEIDTHTEFLSAQAVIEEEQATLDLKSVANEASMWIGLTDLQINSYIDNNSTDLTSANDVMKDIAKGVRNVVEILNQLRKLGRL